MLEDVVESFKYSEARKNNPMEMVDQEEVLLDLPRFGSGRESNTQAARLRKSTKNKLGLQ